MSCSETLPTERTVSGESGQWRPESLPSADLLQRQSQRLAVVRSRLLRRVRIAARQRVLDLGAGYGAVTGELVRRCGGQVIALDRQPAALTAGVAEVDGHRPKGGREPPDPSPPSPLPGGEGGGVRASLRADPSHPSPFSGAHRVCGDAGRLPFADRAFDLVFSQFTLLWMNAGHRPDCSPVGRVIAELFRVLQPGGAVVAIEPDYEAMIEYPPSIAAKDLWQSGLRRAGAEPCIGRQLPALLQRAGFEVRVELVPEMAPAEGDRFALLRGLPLTADEQTRLRRLERASAAGSGLCDPGSGGPWTCLVHLPLFLITARRGGLR